MKTREKIDPAQLDLKDTVVSINRVTKVVKGGKNLSFSALVVVGDAHGVVGFGIGKAKEVPSAIKKGIEAAKKNLIRVPVQGTTVPHPIVGRYGAGRVLLKPAPDGTGIIAGAAVRAVVEAAGVTNVLTKSLGSANPHNVVRAAFTALQELKDPQKLMRLRGRDSAEELAGGARRLSETRKTTMAKAKQATKTVKAQDGDDYAREEPDRFPEGPGQGRAEHGPAQDQSHRDVEGHSRDARHDFQGPSPGDGGREGAEKK